MRIEIILTEKDLKRLVVEELRRQIGDAASKIEENDVNIETKSSQNYRSEWEAGAGFRAKIDKTF